MTDLMLGLRIACGRASGFPNRAVRSDYFWPCYIRGMRGLQRTPVVLPHIVTCGEIDTPGPHDGRPAVNIGRGH